jgi:hypothetical protein
MQRRLQRFEHALRNTDVRDDDFTAKPAPWQQQMRRLLAKECHGAARLDSDASYIPTRPVDAARYIDSEDRQSARINGRNEFGCVSFERTGKSGAKQRIDDEMHALESIRCCRPNRKRPAARHLGGIAFQYGFVAEQKDADVEAPIAQMTRRDEPISSVVSRPAEDRNPPVGPPNQAIYGIRHGLTGAFHEFEHRNAGFRCQAVRFTRLRSRQHFIHVFCAPYTYRLLCICLQIGHSLALLAARENIRTKMVQNA